MKPFDLVFIVVFLTTVVVAVLALISFLRGRAQQALALLVRLGIGLGVYCAALVGTSVLSPQHYYAIGDAQCSDDWCITVNRADRTMGSGSDTVRVSYVLSSRARRVSQRELHVVSFLVDDHGDRYDPVADANDTPFDTLLAPSQSIPVARRFAIPTGTHLAGVVVARGGSGRFPGCCIIGDEGGFLHRPAMVRIGGG